MVLEDWYFRISMLVFLYIAKKIWNVLYIFWIGPAMNKVDIKSYGQWAMVTGSTDGIGKEYARQLAARGCDIILVSRSLNKLRNVANEIEKEFKVKTKVIQIDFNEGLSIYVKLAKEIRGLEIGTLVNNVGVSYPYLEYFLDLPDWDNLMTKLVNVNIVSLIRVTGLVLPTMLKRDKGIIINLASSANDVPTPLLTVYSATKAFVAKFSEGLVYEYGSQNLVILNLSPGIIATGLSHMEVNVLIPSVKTYVKSSLRILKCANCSSGYFIHSIGTYISQLTKSIFGDMIVRVHMKVALLGRTAMLKKLGQVNSRPNIDNI